MSTPDPYIETLKPLYAHAYDLWDGELGKFPDLVYDIGANDGGYSRQMSGRARVIHAFEPVPEMFEKLVTLSKEECLNVVPFQLGMADVVGEIRGVNVFHAWTLLPDAGHDKPPSHYSGGCDTSKTFDMFMTTVDAHSAAHGDPDFIKLDVDGYEHKVLQGAFNTLRRKPCPIFFEFSYMGERFLKGSAVAMCELIYFLGYRAHSLDGKFIAETAGEMMKYYPEHTSIDVMLMHRDYR